MSDFDPESMTHREYLLWRFMHGSGFQYSASDLAYWNAQVDEMANEDPSLDLEERKTLDEWELSGP
jgi:hypothetical protein